MTLSFTIRSLPHTNLPGQADPYQHTYLPNPADLYPRSNLSFEGVPQSQAPVFHVTEDEADEPPFAGDVGDLFGTEPNRLPIPPFTSANDPHMPGFMHEQGADLSGYQGEGLDIATNIHSLFRDEPGMAEDVLRIANIRNRTAGGPAARPAGRGNPLSIVITLTSLCAS